MIGGMAGVFLAAPPADFQVHNSLFLVAHFHTMIIGVALFGIFAGITYWFPKIIGFTLNERLGKQAFWLWLIGFFVSFIPLYLLGFMGATRRLDHYAASTGWQPLYHHRRCRICHHFCAQSLTQVYQIIVSIRDRKKHVDTTGDPWNGRTLEWSTSSPPPFYNFAVIPAVTSREPFGDMKNSKDKPQIRYEDVALPKNTGMGIYISGFAFLVGFAIVWHILWLALLGLVCIIACIILRSFDDDTEYELSAVEIERVEKSKIRR